MGRMQSWVRLGGLAWPLPGPLIWAHPEAQLCPSATRVCLPWPPPHPGVRAKASNGESLRALIGPRAFVRSLQPGVRATSDELCRPRVGGGVSLSCPPATNPRHVWPSLLRVVRLPPPKGCVAICCVGVCLSENKYTSGCLKCLHHHSCKGWRHGTVSAERCCGVDTVWGTYSVHPESSAGSVLTALPLRHAPWRAFSPVPL